MPDLRLRTFRIRVYGQLCPGDLPPAERQEFLDILDRMDEDGMASFFQGRRLDPHRQRALELLREAREIGDRLNLLDRTLPALPHVEISQCYARLRDLGNEVGDLEAAGLLS